MGLTFAERFYERCWRDVDDAIVDGLRKAGRPIPAEDLAHSCHVSHLCTPAQLRDSLCRLIEQGRIRRRTIEQAHPRWPLLQRLRVEVYEIAEGGDRHGRL